MRYQDVVCALIVAQPGDVDVDIAAATVERLEEERADVKGVAGTSDRHRPPPPPPPLPHGPPRILCTLRPTTTEHFAGLYEYPGGKVDAGETQVQALVRECREELGVEVAVVSHEDDGGGQQHSGAAAAAAATSAVANLDPRVRPCYAFHHAPRPDRRLGGSVVFRLWFYWARIIDGVGGSESPGASATGDHEHTASSMPSPSPSALPSRPRPRPQALASDELVWLTPAQMAQRAFCPGDEGIIAALADGALRPPRA